jgi:hypothetical protein
MERFVEPSTDPVVGLALANNEGDRRLRNRGPPFGRDLLEGLDEGVALPVADLKTAGKR